MFMWDVLKIMLYLLVMVVLFSPSNKFYSLKAIHRNTNEVSAGLSYKWAGEHSNGSDRELCILSLSLSPNWSRYPPWLIGMLEVLRGFSSVVQQMGRDLMFAKEREVADNVNLSTAGFGFLSLGM
jgi:hypothetical protein